MNDFYELLYILVLCAQMKMIFVVLYESISTPGWLENMPDQ